MAGEKEILLASGNLGKWRYSLFFLFFFVCLLACHKFRSRKFGSDLLSFPLTPRLLVVFRCKLSPASFLCLKPPTGAGRARRLCAMHNLSVGAERCLASLTGASRSAEVQYATVTKYSVRSSAVEKVDLLARQGCLGRGT